MAFLRRSALLVLVAMLLTVNLVDSTSWFRFRTRRRSKESGGVSPEDRPDQGDTRLDSLEEMIEKQQKQINELEVGNKLLQVRVDFQEDMIKNLEKDRDFLQSIKDEIVDLKKEVGGLKKDRDDLKDTVDNQKDDIVALRRELAGLADCCQDHHGSGDDESFLPLVRKE